METISNAASTAATTVSTLLYGQKGAENETVANETAGKEPVSGEQGKGTVAEPFDKGNLETPGVGKTTDTSAPGGDYLKLDPTTNAPTATDSTSHGKTGGTTESGVPVLPLAPEDSKLDGKQPSTTSATNPSTTASTGATTGATDSTTKPTDTTTTSTTANTTSDTTTTTTTTSPHDAAKAAHTHGTNEAAKKENSTAKDITEIDALKTSEPPSHSVDDAEANDPHSKMTGKTVRAADASKTGASSETKAPTTTDGTPSKSTDSTKSPTGSEKSKRFSVLKTKIKDKLHLGSKEKPASS